jgi:hypothetical protein
MAITVLYVIIWLLSSKEPASRTLESLAGGSDWLHLHLSILSLLSQLRLTITLPQPKSLITFLVTLFEMKIGRWLGSSKNCEPVSDEVALRERSMPFRFGEPSRREVFSGGFSFAD